MLVLPALLLTGLAHAQPPGLVLTVDGPPVQALAATAACDVHESPDAPARAIRLADGTVQLYATDQVNQLDIGPDLLHLRRDCAVVYRGAGKDDPAAYDDRSWLASPWTQDGQTIWVVVHNEFHGHRRPELCPTGRYMDCWFNALSEAVSTDAGRSFQRLPDLVAALPYRYDEVGLGHHGYFNSSNIVARDGSLYMFAFATAAIAQQSGNCLLRTDRIGEALSWRAWDGHDFTVRFVDPYRNHGQPEQHVCTPVAPSALRWPVTSLVRHQASGLFIAIMQDTSRSGGAFYTTSVDLLQWSAPVLLVSTVGRGSWTCGDRAPVAYPSLLDPASVDRNFQTVGDGAELFATEFNLAPGCQVAPTRALIRWHVRIQKQDLAKD